MRKLPRYASIPLGIGLALGIGFAGAQIINKALQLSQDATGAFSVDTTNGVYFPGHVLTTAGVGNPAPTVTSGVGTPIVSGTDFAGTITAGTASTGVNLTFGRAYVTTPTCLASWTPTPNSPISYVSGTTGVQFSQGPQSGNKISYICTGPN